MPGPQPDRLEALQNRDVLGGVGGLGQCSLLNRKSPANRRFCGLGDSVSETAVGRAALARLAAAARRTVSRSASSSIAAVSAAAAAASLGARRPGSAAARLCRRRRRGDRARREAERRRGRVAEAGGELRADLVGQPAELEGPGRGGGRVTSSVPSRRDPLRPGGAGDRVADRVRPGARRPPRAPGVRDAGRARARGAREPSSRSISRLHPPGRDRQELRRRERQRLGARRRDDRLPRRADPLAQEPPAARVELGEHVVEQQERRDPAPLGEQLRLGEQQREHGEPLLALRAEAAQVAVAGERCAMSSRCGPSPVVAALEVAVERAARAPRASAARRRSSSAASGRPSSAARSANAGREQRDRVAARRDERAPELGDLLRPRCERVAGRTARPRRGAARRCAGRPRRRSRAAGRRAPGSSRPSERSKYARRAAGPPLTTARRSGVKTSVAHLAAQLLGRAEGGAVEPRPLRLASRERHLDARARDRPARAAQRDPARRRAVRIELRVRAASAARSPACRRAATRAGSSCRRRSRPSTSTRPGSSASSSRRTTGSRGA